MPHALWVRLARALLRRYPFARGRVRLSALLLAGSPFGPFPGPSERITAAIPEGAVVDCRHGVRLRLHRDPAYIWPFLYGEYEEPQTRVYSRLIEKGDVVVDAGANFGWYTALFARLVGPGCVHAFEPVPVLARLAEDTIRLNGVDASARVNVAGLGREEGEFVVYTFAGLPLGHASADDLGRSDGEAHRCRLTTLDRYAEEVGLERLDLVKVDVEGDEVEVFRGAREVLTRFGPRVSFELNLECLRLRDRAAADVFDLLRSYGYRSFWAITERATLEPVTRPLARTNDYVAATGSELPPTLRHDGTRRRGELQ